METRNTYRQPQWDIWWVTAYLSGIGPDKRVKTFFNADTLKCDVLTWLHDAGITDRVTRIDWRVMESETGAHCDVTHMSLNTIRAMDSFCDGSAVHIPETGTRFTPETETRPKCPVCGIAVTSPEYTYCGPYGMYCDTYPYLTPETDGMQTETTLGTILSIEELPDGYFPRQEWTGYRVTTDRHVLELLISAGQQCCESYGYISTPDDVTYFIGAELFGYDLISDAGDETGDDFGEYSDTQFVNLNTSLGVLQLSVYNAHNGYYGHAIRVTFDGKDVLNSTL